MAREKLLLQNKAKSKIEVEIGVEFETAAKPARIETQLSGITISPVAGGAKAAEKQKKYYAINSQTGTLFISFDEATLPAAGSHRQMQVSLEVDGPNQTLVID